PAAPRRAARARRAARRLREGKTAVPVLNPAAPLLALVELFLPGRSTAGRAATPSRRDPAVERDVRSILDKAAQPLWETAIRYAVATTTARHGADATGRLRG